MLSDEFWSRSPTVHSSSHLTGDFVRPTNGGEIRFVVHEATFKGWFNVRIGGSNVDPSTTGRIFLYKISKWFYAQSIFRAYKVLEHSDIFALVRL